MANDYIPADDAGLKEFALNFVSTITGAETSFGLVAGDTTALDAAADAFVAAHNTNSTAQNASRVARQNKDIAATALRDALRSAARRVQAAPATSDAHRVALGLTVRDETPTRVAPPSSQPSVFVNTANRLQHVISFNDANTPTSRAKPLGVLGCEIHRKIGGTAPLSLAECEFVAMDTKTPYIAEYGSAQGGVLVHYIARWVNRNGEAGPISDVVSATVVA